jgi:hypothetical protein
MALLERIRREDPELGAAMDREEAEPGYRMGEELRARLDAWLTGQGYLYTGRRLAPDGVVIVRPPAPELRWWIVQGDYAEALVAETSEERAIAAAPDADAYVWRLAAVPGQLPTDITPPGPPLVAGVYVVFAE